MGQIRPDLLIPGKRLASREIYYRYHFPDKFAVNQDMPAFLLRVLVTGVFSGSPDNLIDKLVRNLQ